MSAPESPLRNALLDPPRRDPAAEMPGTRARFQARLTAQGAGGERFEILFIQAGEANGWSFSEQVLRESAPLWESASVFVDHSPFGRSVRDLGGVLSDVRYSEEQRGLTAELTACGPSKGIVLEAARLLLAGAPAPDLGFSADVIFTADSLHRVEKIVRPLSVDLVVDPAFATRFIRQLNSAGVQPMWVQLFEAHDAAPAPAHERSPMSHPIPNAAPPADEQAELRQVLHAQRVEAGRELLRLKLDNAGLPGPACEDLRRRFDGRAFEPSELDAAVRAWQDSLAAVAAPGEIRGPARISAMFDSHDQLQAAIDDLIGAPREQGAQSLQAARFQGVREAYLHLTGDRDFVGGFFPDRIQFQHASASFPALLTNSLNKALRREWEQLGRAGYDWWTRIATVEHFNTLQDITWMIFGTVGSLPAIGEGAEYPELKLGDGSETSSFVKRGGYIGLTLEALDKDDTRRLRLIPRELANAGLREISSLVAGIFTQASGAGPTLTDGGALFNSTAVTTAGGHANLLVAALGTDFSAWDAAAAAMYNQPMLVANETGYTGTGKKMAIEPKYVLVPRALKAQAEALFIPRWAGTVEAAIASKGGPTYGGYVEPLTVPEWTDPTDWAAVADPLVMPGIMIGERFGLVPQIFVAGSESDPAMFSNDESRIKVRHFVAVGVCDFRPLHKNNVAG